MSTDEYVPSEQDLEVAWIEFEASADDINVASAEFDRFLARVRRDAAREALDGLADDFDMWHQDMPTDEVARRIRHEMKLLHPEEETP